MVAEAVEDHGGLDGVVYAVGMSGRRLGDGPLETCTDEAWDTLLRVNLTSAMWLLRAVFPAMRASGGGAVALVGSALARSRDREFHTVGYAVTKSALETLARFAAYEGAPHGIRVNVAAAGLVDTPMAGRALTDERVTGRLDDLMPLSGRASRPAEVAEVVCWLLSDASVHVTGAVIPTDAGWTL